MAELTQAYLKQILNYDPETGVFTWLRSWGWARVGAVAGGLSKDGYHQISIDGKTYPAHRLAWLYVKGVWPKDQIDHEDLCKPKNVWANLREATNGQNQCNTHKRCNNTSGFKGVSWNKRHHKWQARITVEKRAIHLGLFAVPEDAHAAYCAASEKHFGKFARVE